MSGDCAIRLRLGNLIIPGDRVDVCIDILRNLTNVEGDTMGEKIDSYMSTLSSIEKVDGAVINSLVSKREAAKNEVQSMGLTRSMFNQEFNWRGIKDKGPKLKAYLKAVDDIAQQVTEEGGDLERTALNIGAYIDNKANNRYAGIFNPQINSGDLSYATEEVSGKDNPLMNDPKIRERVKRKINLGKDEFIMNIIGLLPPNLTEEHFKTELENEHTFSGGIHGRENYDTFVAIIGKKRNGKVVYTKNAKGQMVPDCEAVLHTYSPHGHGSQTDVSELIGDEKGIHRAIMDSLKARAKSLAAEMAVLAQEQGEKQTQLVKDFMAWLAENSEGEDFNKADVDSYEFETVVDEVVAPPLTVDENGNLVETVMKVQFHTEIWDIGGAAGGDDLIQIFD